MIATVLEIVGFLGAAVAVLVVALILEYRRPRPPMWIDPEPSRIETRPNSTYDWQQDTGWPWEIPIEEETEP